MKARKVYRIDIANAALITLWQSAPDDFDVVYGLETKAGLDYAEAAKQLGFCIFHALACEGKLDNGN